MKLLEERIKEDGRVLKGDILKVDSFLNHQLDPKLIHELALEFKNHFEKYDVNKIVTIEASGIAIAIMLAYEMNVPCVFAKKAKSANIGDDNYTSLVHSYTYDKDNVITLSKRYLNENDKVIIIDDFLANGAAMNGLIDICNQANATICGIGAAIEKGFQPGGKSLRESGYDVLSLAVVESMEDGLVFKQYED